MSMIQTTFRSPAGRFDTGLTLVEVMVAVFVIVVGLLGISGLQLQGMKVVTESAARTQAALLAQGQIDRMRVNVAGADSYEDTSCDSQGCVKDGAGITLPSTCSTAICNFAEIAAMDLDHWNQALVDAKSLLSSAAAAISKDANDVWTIRLFWNDARIYGEDAVNRYSAANLDCDPEAKTSLQCYQVSFIL